MITTSLSMLGGAAAAVLLQLGDGMNCGAGSRLDSLDFYEADNCSAAATAGAGSATLEVNDDRAEVAAAATAGAGSATLAVYDDRAEVVNGLLALASIAAASDVWKLWDEHRQLFDRASVQLIESELASRAASHHRAEMEEFLSASAKSGKLSPAHVGHALRRWDEAAALVPRISRPTVSLQSDSRVQFTWHGDRYYLDLDVHADGRMEWFFMDKEKDAADGSGDDELLSVATPELRDALRVATLS